MFEDEYRQKKLNFEFIISDASLLLPPTGTPLTGLCNNFLRELETTFGERLINHRIGSFSERSRSASDFRMEDKVQVIFS